MIFIIFSPRSLINPIHGSGERFKVPDGQDKVHYVRDKVHDGDRIYPLWISNLSMMVVEISLMVVEYIHYGYRIVPLSTDQGPLWRWNFSV
jgi:hypothetical protein